MTSMRMSFCLKAATELADDDLDAITSTIEQAMKGGMDDKAAELLAVNDQLAVVELERRELVQLIQAQHGERLKAKPQEPGKQWDGMPKARRGELLRQLFGQDADADSRYAGRSWADFNVGERDTLAGLMARNGQNDRDSFTLQRLNRDTNKMEPVTFERGEFVEFSVGEGGPKSSGEIDGISHARKEFSVDGLWHAFGYANKAERPAQPAKPGGVPLSSVVDSVNAKYGQGLTDADRVPQPVTMARLDAFWTDVRAGKTTPQQFKAMFADFRAGKQALIDELSKDKKDTLLSRGGPAFASRWRSSTKPEVAEAVYRDALGEFSLSEGVSYVMGSGRDGYGDALAKLVEATTQEKLTQYADAIKAADERADARREKVAEAVQDPKTLEDYTLWFRSRSEGGKTFRDLYLELTEEQRAAYDRLRAEETRGARKDRKDAQRATVQASGQNVSGQVIATKHTKKGHDLFVVQLAERVSREDYEALNSSAKKMGGYYSSYRGGGAIPGFQFTERSQAEAFTQLAGGDASQAQEVAQARRDAFEDDRSQTAAERLDAMGEKLQEQASASRNVDRKANTARRARFAASAEANASALESLGKTMQNMAAAMKSGAVKFLDRVRERGQVELLRDKLRRAHELQQQAKGINYTAMQEGRGDPLSASAADYAEWPYHEAFRSDLATLARRLVELDGTKQLGQKLLKIADDVSDSYLEFAKANYHKVATFATKDGTRPAFTTRAAAEAAIARSGYKGRAIPYQVKRGEHTIIQSPSEAMGRGLWNGDPDKRITLPADLGEELVQKLGRLARRADAKLRNIPEVPWQLERAQEQRAKLARMGIETPPEFRAALREFFELREAPAEASKVKQLERAMVGRRKDGLDFFPTPQGAADEMVAAADLQAGMRVLEPSAGMGHIAERIREAGVEPDTVEISEDRRELLEAKGFNVVGRDFLDFNDANQAERGFTYGDLMQAPDGKRGILRGQGGMGSDRVRLVSDDAEGRELGKYNFSELEGIERRGVGSGYDRILMNPPFSDRRDAEHVRHAYSLLKPGGRIVAIMGEGVFFGQDKKAEAFRDWLAELGATDEKLPAGTFNDPSLPVTTSVSARMVVIDKPGSEPAFSRGQAGQGIRPSAVQAAVDRITGKWGNAPEVEVLGSMADAPEAVRNHDAKMRSQGAQGEPEGFFYKGKVYLNASMLGDQAAVERVLFHETLGHFGLRGAFGTELDAVLRQVIGGRRAEVEAKRQAYGLPDTDAGRLVAAEEVLAELAQTKPELGLVQRAMAAIRSLLRKLGLVDGLSDAELVRNFITPARDFVERGGQAQDFTDTEPMVRQVFSRMTQSQAFKRWFGDSKVVDAEGKPLAVYHGTRHDFTEFDTERGELGAHFGTAEQADRVLDFWRAKKYQGLRVMPAYLAIRNPLRLKDSGHFGRLAVGEQLVRMGLLDRVPTASEGIEAVKQAIIDAGFDGVVYENTREGKGDSWIAFRPEQIKSATGNNGQYDPANPDIRFSLDKPLVDEDGLDGTRYSRAPSRQAFADFMEATKDRTSTSRFNFLHKTLATQLHKAWVDKDYSKVFERAQDFERDIARAAARPAEAAPDLMPAFDNVRSAWHRFTHGNKDAERIKEVGAALWAGTLEGGPEPHTGKVWSAAQLRERFKFDDEQIKLYEQARAAIGASLDESAAALAFEMVKAYAPGLRDAVRREPGKLRELLEGERELLEAMGDDASAALYQALGVLDRADELKAGGYMPLMRFGKYAVSVTNDAGEVLHFEKHETELQAKTAALKLRREYPAAKVERSTMDTEGFKLFAGVDPESVALFAKQLEGHIQDDALQQWYRNAVSERSAMKRMIGPRKGTAGFDQDLRRVLASFITSNARLAARQLNMGDMTAAIQDMRERRVAGDVVDEAVKLKEYLENPDEPFKGLRSLMFTWYLGGSVASAAVNATQPLMMTLPYLSQFGSATKALLGATKEAMTGKVSDEKLAKAMQRAAEDGKVDPQEIHHLYHEGMSGVIDRLPGGDSLKARAQGAATLWGYMFGAVENFNRRLTFIAAYRMAEGKPELGDPYSFAIKAIDETQGIYGKSNRPNWARGTGSFGAVGVAAFTFKQYSIGYVELLVRLAKSGPKGQLAVASMLGLLFLAAGMQGLPFAEDLEDLADTVAQKLGYRGNSRAAMREILHDKMGTQLGDLVMYGASGALPLDIQGRLGMGNLAPATGIFMETNRDRKGQQIAEIFGPMGGFASQVGDAYSAKDASGVLASFAPIAIKNALKGMEMADTGQYKDMRGRNVTETDGTDAFLKGIGFQPTSVASVRRPERLIAQDVTRVRQVEADIVRMRAQAMAESDPDLRREADEALREWNERNPELRIRIKDSQVARMVKEMRRTSRDRLLDTAPKETRRALEDSLG